jgi:hypothetical protein
VIREGHAQEPRISLNLTHVLPTANITAMAQPVDLKRLRHQPVLRALKASKTMMAWRARIRPNFLSTVEPWQGPDPVEDRRICDHSGLSPGMRMATK